jgi:hypothetical protein
MEKKSIITASVVIESMRDNGYKNAAYALAEIVDNSIQAEADSVKILSFEYSTLVRSRTSKQIQVIAILDNGRGMDPQELYSALAFGESTHRENKTGMGKFGMGLPNASISQCKKVEVWSWKGLDSINYTYLDIDEIIKGNEHIPLPILKDIPIEIRKSLDGPLPEHGTLVLWTKLDKLHWVTSKTLFKHSELRIGRMYRNFLSSNAAVIRFLSYEVSSNGGVTNVKPCYNVRANDPMYLEKNETFEIELPDEFKNESFFEINEDYEKKYEFNNKMHIVKFRSSYPKKNIWDAIRRKTSLKVGNTTWGKHCAANFGLSIMRSNREIDLDSEFITWNLNKFRDSGRFCGIEIEFPPSLDKAFGLTNNKQHVVNLKPMDKDKDASYDSVDSTRKYLESLKENGSGKDIMYEVVSEIKKMRDNIYDLLKPYPSGNPVHNVTTNGVTSLAGEMATKGSEQREKEWETQFGESALIDTDVIEALVDSGENIGDATETAKYIVNASEKFHFTTKPLETEAFFDVTTKNGFALIQINENHKFYEKVLSKIEEEERQLLEVVLGAWARLEHETVNNDKLRSLQNSRRKWGEILDTFYDVDEHT